jgi:hypothetical protein
VNVAEADETHGGLVAAAPCCCNDGLPTSYTLTRGRGAATTFAVSS